MCGSEKKATGPPYVSFSPLCWSSADCCIPTGAEVLSTTIFLYGTTVQGFNAHDESWPSG